MTVLSERQRRELDFYEEFSKRNPPSKVSFASITGDQVKPWNSYWQLLQIAQRNFRSTDQKLLDFGCGTGEFAVIYSKIGYEVFGFDISPTNIAIAKHLASKYQMSERTHFQVSVGEKLDYPSDYFDVIVGTDILHHVEINQALPECSRILKKAGMAIFHEPVRVPIFDSLRESRLGRWLVPKKMSLERHITQDEKKLTVDDLKLIESIGLNFSIQYFLLFSRLDRFIKISKASSFLEKLDSYLFEWFPFLKRFGGIIIVVFTK